MIVKRYKYFTFLVVTSIIIGSSVFIGMGYNIASSNNTFTFIKQNELVQNGMTATQSSNWVFVNPSRWAMVSLSNVPSGNSVLEAQSNTENSGLIFDTVQLQNINITDGSIEGWVYTTDSFKTIGIWIRTGAQTSGRALCTIGPQINQSHICSGYFLQFYDNYANIVVANEQGKSLQQINFINNIADIWWHVKLQAIGTTISAWVTTSSFFSNNPTMQVNDSTYSSGYAAISARTTITSGNDYFDALSVSNGSTIVASGPIAITTVISSPSFTATSTSSSLFNIGLSNFFNPTDILSIIATLIIIFLSLMSIGLIIAFVYFRKSHNLSARSTNYNIPIFSIKNDKSSSNDTNHPDNLVIRTSRALYDTNTPKTCIRCGQPINTEDTYCFYCGQKQV